MPKHKKIKSKNSKLQIDVLRVTRTGFAFIVVFLLTTIIMDSWNLLTHESVGLRWISAGLLLVVNTAVWYFARCKSTRRYYTGLVMTLVVSQIIFATMNIYWERGMASALPIIFAVPILTAGALKRRTALLTATVLSAGAYSTSVVVYFTSNYGEGYRIQLWAQIFFFSGLFFVIAWLAMVLAGLRHDSE